VRCCSLHLIIDVILHTQVIVEQSDCHLKGKLVSLDSALPPGIGITSPRMILSCTSHIDISRVLLFRNRCTPKGLVAWNPG
jgi:hypothetical protein